MKKYLFLFITILLLSCQNQESNPLAGAEYSPVEIGNFWIYDVKSEVYSLTEKAVFQNYQIKEKVGVEISKNTFTIEVSRRNSNTEPWKPLANSWIEIRPDAQIKAEGSSNIVLLKYPISQNAVWWTSEQVNTKQNQTSIRNFGLNYDVMGKSYSPTISVYQKNDSSLVETNRSFAVFAKNIGQIYKENTAIAYCQNTDCVGKGKPDNGFRIKQSLISYGKE
jgi:hypothetical protein